MRMMLNNVFEIFFNEIKVNEDPFFFKRISEKLIKFT